MPFSGGAVKDVISALVKRMDKKLSPPTKEKLQSLIQEFEQEKETKRRVRKELEGVLRRVDVMLVDAAVSESGRDNPQFRDELTDIEERITGMIKQGKSDKEASTPDAEGRIQGSEAASEYSPNIEELSSKLKQCLFCLSIFPEDAVIKRRLLIHWWIGENIVESAGDGKECFELLRWAGFIIPIVEKHCETAHSCKVPHGLPKLLKSMATSNAFLEFDLDGTPSENYSRSHRPLLSKRRLLAGRSKQKTEKGKKAEEDEEGKVKTLYNIDAQYVDFESSWFFGKKELRTLQLGRWQSSEDHHVEISGSYILKDLGACMNLRYLSLRGVSRVEKLPDSVGSLRMLAVLDLRACQNLEKLTSKIRSLKNLEYFDVSECYLLAQLPKGLKHLTKLQVLKGFVIAHAGCKDPCHIGELARLEKLRKLSISVGQESDHSQLQSLTEGSIEFKAPLTSLTITWGIVCSKNPQPSDNRTTAAAARGHPRRTQTKITAVSNLMKLEKLDIRAFPEKLFPNWISPSKLPNLKKLYIRGGKLESFGKDEGWKMEVLRIRFLHHLSCDVGTKQKLFPDLRFTEIHKCPGMNSWRSLESVTWVADADAPAAAAAVPSEIGPQAADASAAPAVFSKVGPQVADASDAPAVFSKVAPPAADASDAPAVFSKVGPPADADAAAAPLALSEIVPQFVAAAPLALSEIAPKSPSLLLAAPLALSEIAPKSAAAPPPPAL